VEDQTLPGGIAGARLAASRSGVTGGESLTQLETGVWPHGSGSVLG